MKLTGKEALELTLEEWLLVLDGHGKSTACDNVVGKHEINHPALDCFLCGYSLNKGDRIGCSGTCEHCPCLIIAGHCMASGSPYRAWSNSEGGSLVPDVISMVLGIQAEWERRYGRKNTARL